MVTLLKIPEVVSLTTFQKDGCGGVGYAEAEIFIDDIFANGWPSQKAVNTFLRIVLERVFVDSIRDPRCY
jgi:hypothetical protein